MNRTFYKSTFYMFYLLVVSCLRLSSRGNGAVRLDSARRRVYRKEHLLCTNLRNLDTPLVKRLP